MNALYKAIGTSKQAFHQQLNRMQRRKQMEVQVMYLMEQFRRDHPRMGIRKIWQRMRPEGIGQKRFEELAKQQGYSVVGKERRIHNTEGNKVERFPNLVKGIQLKGINEVWVSDITYIEAGGRFYYLTIMLDLYSRRIIGYCLSAHLQTEKTTIPALKEAMERRKKIPAGLILHSDGGGQYYSKKFCQLTQRHGIRNSMAETVYENSTAERVFNTLKNEYLEAWVSQEQRSLKRNIIRAVQAYNYGRPHNSLLGLTPVEYEKLSTYPQEFTKEKRSKKENINNNDNITTSKTVNAICA